MYTLNDIANIQRLREISAMDHEHSVVLYLNKNYVRWNTEHDVVGNNGNVKTPSIDLVDKECKKYNTKTVILAHNHPVIDGESNVAPSEEDLKATEWFKLQLMQKGITLADHIIVTKELFFSFRQNGLL